MAQALALDQALAKPVWQEREKTRKRLWILFFGIIYAVVIMKLAFGHYALNGGIFFGIYSVTITLFILSRFLLSYLHRAVPAAKRYEPGVSFVVPAKNEGDNIYETIRRFGAVDYPKDKIEVIAINDGSTDRTLDEMRRAADDLRDKVARVEVVDWKKNRGKRHGMHEGVVRATNDIIIFVDSDSFVEPGSVRHLVKHFVDPRVGAVSGHTNVYNRDTNLLTKMQSIRYYISFRIFKSAESVFGAVTCSPGCLSAYRRSYLMEFIDEWLHQTFLGAPCTFGDDRSLTNFVLQREHKAVYSPEAKAYTVVPDTFRQYVKQQQRWKKSWVRETFIASSFLWRRQHPVAALFFYVYILLSFVAPVIFIRAVIWEPVRYGIMPIVYLLGLFLVLALYGTYYRIHVDEPNWFVAVAAYWFYSVILMWQLVWAFVTIADSRWGTR